MRLIAIAAALAGACGPNSGNPGGTGGTNETGGTTGTGGTTDTGGTTGTGGSSATGGTIGTGGVSPGTGGSAGHGATGGSVGTGGSAGHAGGGVGGGTGGLVMGIGGSGGVGGGAAGGHGGTGTGTGGTIVGTGGITSSGGTGGSATGGAGGASNANVYNPNFVEFYGSDCTVATPKDVSISGQLPNLFTKLDGTTMSKRSDWKCRRAEMKAVVEKYIFGAKPAAPTTVTGSVSSTQIKVHVDNGGGKTIDFTVPIVLPPSPKGPVPIIIGLTGSSLPKSITDAEGVATGTYDIQGMMSESSRTGLFTTIYGTSTGVSSQIGWAWGFSRIIDVIVSEKAAGRNNIIDPTGIGVTGCSRDGKGAFTVGAFDERIALGIPQESGTAGVSAMRIVNTQPKGPNGNPAQSLSNAVQTEVGWFGSTFESTYISKVDTIPGDTHSLAAMHLPRGLLVLDNSRIGELCATCQHAATDAAEVLAQALGVGPNVGYNGGNPSDPQNHCTFYMTTQGPPLQRAIRGHLTKTAAPDGRMEPQPAGTADLTKWVPWSTTAPTLTNDVSWSSPPLTSQ
jgi:hypothetical protein